jgi:hypothetical protein
MYFVLAPRIDEIGYATTPGLSLGWLPYLQFASDCEVGLLFTFENAIYARPFAVKIALSLPCSVIVFAFKYRVLVSPEFEITRNLLNSGAYKLPVLSVIFAIRTGLVRVCICI